MYVGTQENEKVNGDPIFSNLPSRTFFHVREHLRIVNCTPYRASKTDRSPSSKMFCSPYYGAALWRSEEGERGRKAGVRLKY